MIDRTEATERRLTHDEELDLVRRVEAGDYTARNELITTHLWVVRVNVRHFADKGVDAEDLYSEGLMGLIDAAEKCALGEARFATWAAYRVRGAMTRAIANYGRLIRKGCDAESRARQGWKVRDRLRLELGREPTHDEIVARMPGLSTEKAESLRAAMTDHGAAWTDQPTEVRDRLLSWVAVTKEPDGREPDVRERADCRAEKLRKLERAVSRLQRQLPHVAEHVRVYLGRRWTALSVARLAAVVDKLEHIRVTQPDLYEAILQALEFLRAEVKKAG